MNVRRALLEDANAIATIHVRAWQHAYRGIVPDAVLDSLSISQRRGIWHHNLQARSSETWVAEDHEEILGWISAGQSRDADAVPATGEIWAIYVAPEHWRHGVGRLLWRQAEEHLRHYGFSEVTLWVLKENAQGIGFYESLGMAADPAIEQTITRGGAELREIRMRKSIVA